MAFALAASASGPAADVSPGARAARGTTMRLTSTDVDLASLACSAPALTAAATTSPYSPSPPSSIADVADARALRRLASMLLWPTDGGRGEGGGCGGVGGPDGEDGGGGATTFELHESGVFDALFAYLSRGSGGGNAEHDAAAACELAEDRLASSARQLVRVRLSREEAEQRKTQAQQALTSLLFEMC